MDDGRMDGWMKGRMDGRMEKKYLRGIIEKEKQTEKAKSEIA